MSWRQRAPRVTPRPSAPLVPVLARHPLSAIANNRTKGSWSIPTATTRSDRRGSPLNSASRANANHPVRNIFSDRGTHSLSIHRQVSSSLGIFTRSSRLPQQSRRDLLNVAGGITFRRLLRMVPGATNTQAKRPASSIVITIQPRARVFIWARHQREPPRGAVTCTLHMLSVIIAVSAAPTSRGGQLVALLYLEAIAAKGCVDRDDAET